MKRIRKYRNYLILFAFVVAAFVAFKIIDNVPFWLSAVETLFSVALPFIYGFVIAFILSIPMNKLEGLFKRRESGFACRHSRGIAVLVLYIALLVIIGLTVSFVIPPMAKSLIELVGKLPSYYTNAVDYVKSFAVDGKIAGFSIAFLDGFTLDKLLSGIDFGVVSTYAQGVVSVGGSIVRFFISVIISVYMLLSKEALLGSLKRLLFVIIPRRTARMTTKYVHIICDTFYKYIYSQLLDALIVGICCVIAFTIVGVPYSALLGIAVGLANLIPYFGAIVSGVCVALITLISDGPVSAIIVAVLIVVIQQVDGNVIQPKIVGSNVGIKPIYVLFAITVGGGLFGVPGMVIGVPTVAVIKTVLSDIISYREKRMRKKAALNHEILEDDDADDIEE